MNPEIPQGTDPSPTDPFWMDRICDRFEADWKGGGRPAIEDALAREPGAARAALLRELILLEVAYRLRLGERPERAEYLARFPEHAARILAAFDEVGLGDTMVGGTPTVHVPSSAPGPPEGHVLIGALDFDPQRRERYALTRLHAKGGIGQVWLARDDSLGREVALKELQPQVAGDPDVWARFLAEAKITGQLEHPGIVPVYELARREGDRAPFYTMRFVRGRTLSEATRAYHATRREGRAERLDLLALLNAFVGVCNAVAFAHSRGVIHRDLKGQNVVLGDFGEVIVLDWGLAKLVDRPEAGAGSPVAVDGRGATVAGDVMGTPAYMAPEQAEGRVDLIDQRTDVYGLGATLYEVLTGRPPFSGPGPNEILRRVREDEPERPRAVCPDTPAALEAVCLKAMAKRPSQRYPSAAELAQEVRRWLADEPVAAWREPLPVRARRWAARHRTALTATAAAAVVALVGLAALLASQAHSNARLAAANANLADANGDLRKAILREQEARTRAQARFDLAKSAVEAYYNGATKDVLLKQPEMEDLRNRLLRTALDFYRRLAADLQGDQGIDPQARGELGRASYQVAYITNQIGQSDDAFKAFQQALELNRGFADADPNDLGLRLRTAQCLNQLGYQYFRIGRIRESDQMYREALAIAEGVEKLRPGNDQVASQLAWAHVGLWYANIRTGRPEDALPHLHRALELRRALAKDHPEDIEYQNNLNQTLLDLGYHLRRHGQREEALAPIQEAVARASQLARDHPRDPEIRRDVAAAHNDLAIHLDEMGKPTEAWESYHQSLNVKEALVRAHPTVNQFRQELAQGHYNIGLRHAQEGRWEDASRSYLRSLAIEEDLVRANPKVVPYGRSAAMTRSNLAFVRRRLGFVVESIRTYRRVIEDLERLARDDPDNPDLPVSEALAFMNIAEILLGQGRPEAALGPCQQALGVYQRVVSLHPRIPSIRQAMAHRYILRAEIHAALGRVEEARLDLQNAQEINDQLVRELPRNGHEAALAECYRERARLELLDGRPDEAKRWLAKAGETTSPDSQPDLHLITGNMLEQSGDPAGAVRAYERARRLTEQKTRQYSFDRYRLAVLYSRLSVLPGPPPAPDDPPEPDRAGYAARAVEELRRAAAARYSSPARFRTDPNLDPLRSRADFRELLMDVDFPAEPFDAIDPGP
jgi:serine/threonine-protein kinase